MKGRFLLLILSVFFFLPTFAQKHGDSKDKETKRKEFLEFKLDFLAKEMDLKEDQKKQFFELYSQMENDRRAILKRIKNAEKSISDSKDPSEADYEKATKEIAASRSEMMQIEKQYDEKFNTFLSKKQMFKLKEAENKFMQKMQGCRDKKKHEKKDKK